MKDIKNNNNPKNNSHSKNKSCAKNNSYLITALPTLIPPKDNQKCNENFPSHVPSHIHTYNFIRIKRFFIHTLLIFIFQYQAIIYLPFSNPALPFYPPMGIAFVSFYLLGSNAILGLLLGGFLGYLFKGFSPASILLYLTADVGCGCLGAILSQAIFSSDIRPFAKLREALNFIVKNFFITALFSSLLRFTALILIFALKGDFNEANGVNEVNQFNLNKLPYYFLDLWLSDFNAILIFSAFLFSWVFVPFAREKIFPREFKKFSIITSVIIFIIFILTLLLFIKHEEIIYLLIAGMGASIYLAYFHGYLMATALLFIFSCLYLAYFIIHKQPFLLHFGVELYTVLPFMLLLFTLCMIFIGHFKLKKSI